MFHKGPEVFIPALTDSDAFRSVVFVSRLIWIRAALPHPPPSFSYKGCSVARRRLFLVTLTSPVPPSCVHLQVEGSFRIDPSTLPAPSANSWHAKKWCIAHKE